MSITTIEQAEQRLQEIRDEQHRQMGFAGIRFGVFSKLKELARQERRVYARLKVLRSRLPCKGVEPTQASDAVPESS